MRDGNPLLTVPEAGKSKVRVLVDLALGEALPGMYTATFLHPPHRPSLHVKSLSCLFLL